MALRNVRSLPYAERLILMCWAAFRKRGHTPAESDRLTASKLGHNSRAVRNLRLVHPPTVAEFS